MGCHLSRRFSNRDNKKYQLVIVIFIIIIIIIKWTNWQQKVCCQCTCTVFSMSASFSERDVMMKLIDILA